MENKGLTHLDEEDNPGMVDVSGKSVTKRTATARSIVQITDAIINLMSDGDVQTKKGPVFQTAIIAGTMGAKKTSDLIPLCHPIGMENCTFDIRTQGLNILIDCTCEVTSKTGIEMEALTGASVAALTIYDMCKAMSHEIVIKETKLISKSGGKKDYKINE